MSESWLTELSNNLTHLKVEFTLDIQQYFTFTVESIDWSRSTEAFNSLESRFSGLWTDQHEHIITVFALFCYKKHYFILTTTINETPYCIPSISLTYPAANRMERHIHDLMGIKFIDSPDSRRWIRHQAWSNKESPLTSDFPVKRDSQRITQGDNKYHFFQTQGVGVSEIPVGPIHAGIIEPGHYRFQIMGETILNLEQRLGYTHKGIEKIAVGKTPTELLKLAARVSGDSAVTHAWAAAMAIETAEKITVPDRALYLRAVLSERERIANHIGDIGGICNDVGFAFGNSQCARLRELWQRTNLNIFGHRLLMDTLCIGGVNHNIDEPQLKLLFKELTNIEKDFSKIIDILQDYPSLEDRLMTTGFLPESTAKALGCLGFVGRASGQDTDVRRDAPYPPYDQFQVQHILRFEGDVLCRLQVRVDEVRASFKFLSAILHGLVQGEIKCADYTINGNTQSLGIIAGWRGETFAFVRLDQNGKVVRYFPRDASWLNWQALEALIDNNIVADFPVCNKSVNGSYSGVDL